MALTLAEGARTSLESLAGRDRDGDQGQPGAAAAALHRDHGQRADLQPRELRRHGRLLQRRRRLGGEHPTFTQVTASLAILGGDADVDNYVARTRSNVQDIEAAIVELKAKAVQQQFDTTFVDGDTSSNAKARAAARANAVLCRSRLALARGELTARPHPGLEVGDAIAVTSARAGLAAERFRVAGLRLRYVRGGPRAVYEQRIALGAT